MYSRNIVSSFVGLLLLIFIAANSSYAQGTKSDAGMWLLPQVNGPVYDALKTKGLLLPESAFHGGETSTLNRAIVRINVGEGGGGTGSFVSPRGLILTNHHVAYDGIASNSSVDVNFLKDGFIAKSLNEEIEALGFSLYIPIEQIEVTAQLAQSATRQDARSAEEAMRAARQQIIQSKTGDNPDIIAEIDDYWSGNRQFMSVYRIIRDVRLVFAPPSSIGKFGGDIDNWMWPRHTGDFTFLRAYVAPDGSSRPYDKENVPFVPDRFLQVSADGYKDGEFTMIMGFPGTTYRNESSYHFQYYQESQHPVLIRMFKGIMAGLEAEAASDPELEVATASDRASYANSLKYFEGIHKGFSDYSIVDQRRKQEEAFTEWLKEDIFRQTEYSDVLPMVKKGYENMSQYGAMIYAYVYTLNNSPLLEVAGLFAPAYALLNGELSRDQLDSAEIDSIRIVAAEAASLIDADIEFARLRHFLVALAELPENVRPAILTELFGGSNGTDLEAKVNQFLEGQRTESVIFNKEKAETILAMNNPGGETVQLDPFVQLYRELLQGYYSNIEGFQRAGSFMNQAEKGYVAAMLSFRDDPLQYPDANFTLRLTGGRIMDVHVRDTTFAARTYAEEILPKYSGIDPFDAPERQLKWVNDWLKAKARNPKATASKYADSDGRLVVNFLSSNDITGGNSGSPIMNAKGEIIGVAFDGLIEGVVADYFHDPKYSRTISVDIRYVLHITDELYGLKYLIDEMGEIRRKGSK
jgi:hypothetical protein